MRFNGLFLALAVFLAALVQSALGAAFNTHDLTNSTREIENGQALALEERGAMMSKTASTAGTVYLGMFKTQGEEDGKFHWEIIVRPSQVSNKAIIHHATNPRVSGGGRDDTRWKYETKTVKFGQTRSTIGYVELGRVKSLSEVNKIIRSAAGKVPSGQVVRGRYTCKWFAREVAMGLLHSRLALGKKPPETTWAKLESVALTFGKGCLRVYLDGRKGVATLFLNKTHGYAGLPFS